MGKKLHVIHHHRKKKTYEANYGFILYFVKLCSVWTMKCFGERECIGAGGSRIMSSSVRDKTVMTSHLLSLLRSLATFNIKMSLLYSRIKIVPKLEIFHDTAFCQKFRHLDEIDHGEWKIKLGATVLGMLFVSSYQSCKNHLVLKGETSYILHEVFSKFAKWPALKV